LTEKDKFNLNEQWETAQDQPAIKPPQCDLEKYHEHVKDFDLSEEEQSELLKTIWHIMAAFVDMGFGVDSIQLLPSSTEKQDSLPAQNKHDQDGPINSKGVRHDE